MSFYVLLENHIFIHVDYHRKLHEEKHVQRGGSMEVNE